MKSFIFTVLTIMLVFASTGSSLAQPQPPVYHEGYHTTKRFGTKFVLGAVAANSLEEAKRQMKSSATLDLNQTYFISHGGKRFIFVYLWYPQSKGEFWYVKCDTNNGKGWLMNGKKVGDGKTFTLDPKGSNCIFKVTNADNDVWPRDTILFRWDY